MFQGVTKNRPLIRHFPHCNHLATSYNLELDANNLKHGDTMKRKVLKIGGTYAANFWKAKGYLCQERAHAAKNIDNVWMLADGRALDSALDVCRAAFNRHEETTLNAVCFYRHEYRHSYIYRKSYEMKMDCYLVFFEMLTAYLGLKKDC